MKETNTNKNSENNQTYSLKDVGKIRDFISILIEIDQENKSTRKRSDYEENTKKTSRNINANAR